MPSLTQKQIGEIYRFLDEGKSQRQAAKSVGCARSTVALYAQKKTGSSFGADPIESVLGKPLGKSSLKEDKDGATIERLSDRRIRTLEDAIAFAEVDTDLWYVDTWECTSWEVAMKVRKGQDKDGLWNPEVPERHQLWRVSLKLKRIATKSLIDAIKAVCEKYKFPEYPYQVPSYPKRTERPVACEIDLNDLHFLKLAWHKECGENYDSRIASTRFRNAIQDSLGYASGFNIDEFVIPIGSDMFHVDGPKGQTTSGTPVDHDGRYFKGYMTFYDELVWLFDYLLNFAPVRAFYLPGNHDNLTSFYLCHALQERYRRVEQVSVDLSPRSHKYYRYYGNLIGFTHGDNVPGDGIESLPTVMASECRSLWSKIVHPEWHIGHKHTAKRLSQKDYVEIKGCIIRWLSALTATDKWHYDKFFIGNRKAAEMFLYDREYGCIANYFAVARDGESRKSDKGSVVHGRKSKCVC